MKKNRLFMFVALAALVIGIVGWSLWSRTARQDSSKINVVASTNFWGSIAGQVGGEYVQVTSIMSDPSLDPHLYQSSARDGLAVAQADIAIVNGLGYDDFMDKMLAASPKKDRKQITVATLVGAANDANPHLWYDFTAATKLAQQLATSLTELDPAHAADYQQNLTKFSQSMVPLSDKLAQIKNQHAGKKIAYLEPVVQYLTDAAGLQNATPHSFALAMEEGSEPSLADQTLLHDLIRNKTIAVLIYNQQAESAVTQQLKQKAEQAGIPVVTVTETMPPEDSSYQVWQLRQLDSLAKALDNSANG